MLELEGGGNGSRPVSMLSKVVLSGKCVIAVKDRQLLIEIFALLPFSLWLYHLYSHRVYQIKGNSFVNLVIYLILLSRVVPRRHN